MRADREHGANLIRDNKQNYDDDDDNDVLELTLINN